jgi:hypothetical protein
LGNLTTPNSVQKLQTALHAKAKAEAGYRFYTLYDKISREDILAHAYALCRRVRTDRRGRGSAESTIMVAKSHPNFVCLVLLEVADCVDDQ